MPLVNRRRPGFTLIELLVTVGVISLILSLSLPILGVARDRGRAAVAESRIRTHAQVFHMYASNNRDRWPNVAAPTDQPTWHVINGRPRGIAYYFGQMYAWHFGMVMDYYDGDLFSEVFLRAGKRHEEPYEELWNVVGADVSWYTMSASLLADPAFWNERTRRGPEQWRATRVSEVRYPSQKAILVERDTTTVSDPPSRRSHRLLTASSDGAAARRPLSEHTQPYPNADGNFPGSSPIDEGYYAHHTVDGVHGRDW